MIGGYSSRGGNFVRPSLRKRHVLLGKKGEAICNDVRFSLAVWRSEAIALFLPDYP